MGESSQDLGKSIQRARKIAGVTQQELCQRAGLSYSTLAKIERGAIKTPSVFTVYRIAEVLNTSMDDLLGAVVDAKSPHERGKKTSKSGISFVFFDINGCLVRFYHEAFVLIARDSGISSNVIESSFWHFNDAVCRGDISLQEFNNKFSQQIGVKNIDWSKYYLESVEPIKELQELVVWASKHYKIGLLSNTMPGHISLMIKKGLLPDVKYDAVVDSSEVGAIKPEVKIYEAAEQMSGVGPSEILFIDDSRTNLMAAEHRGWQVLWFDDFNLNESSERIRTALEF